MSNAKEDRVIHVRLPAAIYDALVERQQQASFDTTLSSVVRKMLEDGLAAKSRKAR